MVGSRHRQIAYSLLVWRFGSVEKFELVHRLQIETQHTLRSVNLKCFAISAPHPVTGRLERTDTSVDEAGEKQGGVVDIAPRDESLSRGRKLSDRSVQIKCGIDRVGKQVASRSRARL